MRKITKESAKAFVNFKPYKKDNTEVVIDHLNDPLGKDAKFYLHGYCIVLSGGNGVYRNIDLCGYHTRTTRERINGVLDAWGYDFRIAQRNHEQVLVKQMNPFPQDLLDQFKLYNAVASPKEKILKLSDDSFDPDFAKRVFNSKEFVSGTDLNAITDF
jgi:hypothetical protein